MMRSALDVPEESLDPLERNFVDNIRQHGWFDTHVFGEGALPSFSYTTGFCITLGFPEVIVFSLPKKTAHSILWGIYRDIKAGILPPTGTRVPNILGNADAVIIPCAKSQYSEYLAWSRWFYGGDGFDCVQLVWPDPAGRFPWEPSFDDRFHNHQPDLTESGWTSSLSQ